MPKLTKQIKSNQINSTNQIDNTHGKETMTATQQRCCLCAALLTWAAQSMVIIPPFSVYSAALFILLVVVLSDTTPTAPAARHRPRSCFNPEEEIREVEDETIASRVASRRRHQTVLPSVIVTSQPVLHRDVPKRRRNLTPKKGAPLFR